MADTIRKVYEGPAVQLEVEGDTVVPGEAVEMTQYQYDVLRNHGHAFSDAPDEPKARGRQTVVTTEGSTTTAPATTP